MRNGRAIATFFIIDISSSSRNKSLIILACPIVLRIDIRSGNQIILSDRKALLGSRVAFIFDKGWVRV
jgi:flagellar assembly factor FliW